MSTWVYLESEPGLWTVGYYAPAGAWVSDSDHGSRDDARGVVHYLNGGNPPVVEMTVTNEANLERTPRELISEFHDGLVVSDLPPDVRQRIADYLDLAVRKWLVSPTPEAGFYVDAFQCVRESLIGSQLELEAKPEADS